MSNLNQDPRTTGHADHADHIDYVKGLQRTIEVQQCQIKILTEQALEARRVKNNLLIVLNSSIRELQERIRTIYEN